MKATGYVQIVPLYPRGNPEKSVTGVRLDRLTKTIPRQPEPGALVVKVSIDVDPAVFAIAALDIRLDADPSEVAAAVVPVPVEAPEDEVPA